MRTRRSWRNQDRLYKAIGRDLQRAAAATATPDEAREIMRDLHEMTQKDAPQLDCPFTLDGGIAPGRRAFQPSIFEGEK